MSLNIEFVFELYCYCNVQLKNMLHIASSVILHSGDSLYEKPQRVPEVFK